MEKYWETPAYKRMIAQNVDARIAAAVVKEGFESVAAFIRAKTVTDMLRFPGLGRKSVVKVKEMAVALGLRLGFKDGREADAVPSVIPSGLSEITLKIRVKTKLAERLEPILTDRGMTLDQAVSLYLRGMVNGSERSRAIRLADEMPLGKYRGEIVETIVRGEPGYVRFLFGCENIRFDPEVYALVEEIEK